MQGRLDASVNTPPAGCDGISAKLCCNPQTWRPRLAPSHWTSPRDVGGDVMLDVQYLQHEFASTLPLGLAASRPRVRPASGVSDARSGATEAKPVADGHHSLRKGRSAHNR